MDNGIVFVIISLIFLVFMLRTIVYTTKEKKECVKIGIACGLAYGVKNTLEYIYPKDEDIETKFNSLLVIIMGDKKVANKLIELNNIKIGASQSEFFNLIKMD